MKTFKQWKKEKIASGEIEKLDQDDWDGMSWHEHGYHEYGRKIKYVIDTLKEQSTFPTVVDTKNFSKRLLSEIE